MAEFLLEIFSEEIPARMQSKAADDLASMLTKEFEAAGLTVGDMRSFAGPRRLTAVCDLPLRSPDVKDERKGPRVGAPEKALEGFMRGAGISSIDEAEVRSDKKGDYYVAIIESAGKDTTDIIIAAVPEIMRNFPWPKSMRWGDGTFRWVRPIQRVLCLLDGKIVEFEVAGVTSSNVTEGHRRMGRGPFTVDSFQSYEKQLGRQGHVMLRAEERKALISKEAHKLCEAAGLEWVEDDGLLDEVAGLAEWPVVLLGDMDPRFLELPGEVIRLTMRSHQKYFAVRDPKTGGLAPNFIVVANQVASDGGKAIAEGNARVLSARLSDAVFFKEQDTEQPLESYYDKLDDVVFHQKLGTIKDKAERIQKLARELAPIVAAEADKAAEAAKLAKCDLVTNLVIEFTSLQGQIGALYYLQEHDLAPRPSRLRPTGSAPQDEGQGGASIPHPEVRSDSEASKGEGWSSADYRDIAQAIEDHYKPAGQSDSVPDNPVAIAVALADKLDTLTGFWAIDEKPTGSKDPYALRRAALGVIRTLIENDIRLSLKSIFGELAASLARQKYDSFEAAWANEVEEDPENEGKVFLYCLRENDVLHDKSERRIPASYSEYDLANDGYYLLLQGSAPLFEDGWEDRKLLNWPSIMELGKFQPDLLSFFADRLKVYLRDQGIRHDLIDAVFALGEDDLVAVVNRTKALQNFLETEDGSNLLAGYKRAANILKAEEKKTGESYDQPVDAAKLGQKEATALYEALKAAEPKITKALEAEEFESAMGELAALRQDIDTFFDEVMVNADDPEARLNRLRLLEQIRSTARKVADFEKIQG